MSNSAEPRQYERRLHPRYPIALDAEYRVVNPYGAHQGSCRTVNISSGGVLVEVQAVSSSVGSIEISIEWPCFLDGVVPLKLMVYGNIVRVDGNNIGVQMIGYGFHTAKEKRPKKA